MEINLFRLEIEGSFSELAEYLEALETQIPAIQETEYKKLQKWAERESVDFAEFSGERNGLRWRYEYFFPRSLRYSFIVLLFLTVERQLAEVCEHVERANKLPLNLRDLKGDIVERSKTYLHRFAGVSNTLNWQVLDDLSAVRNCIVHTMGDVTESQKKQHIESIAARGIGLSIGNEDFAEESTIQLSADFCRGAARDAHAFFSALLNAVGMR